jgi:hypothetical protein
MTAATRGEVPPWTCDPRFILCPDEHLYMFRKTGMVRDMRRMAGHDFFRCEDCKPASHFFVVFSTSPDPHATCYLISEACWRQWINDPNVETRSTQEMLYLIRDPKGRNYNPNYRPR